MIDMIRLWQIDTDNTLREYATQPILLEQRIEEWIAKDVRILSNQILVIGKRIVPSIGGLIDFVGVNSFGNVVLIEMKKDKTCKDLISTILEHASWISERSSNDIYQLGVQYYEGEQKFKDQFSSFFNTSFPETLNKRQRMLLISSEFDPGTMRILRYLSKEYGLDMNAVTFSYFIESPNTPVSNSSNSNNPSPKEFITKSYLMDELEVARYVEERFGLPLTNKAEIDLEVHAKKNRVEKIFQNQKIINKYFDQMQRTDQSLVYFGIIENSLKPILSFLPLESSEEKGLRFHIELNHFNLFFQVRDERELLKRLTDSFHMEGLSKEPNWYGGYISTPRDMDDFKDILERYTIRKNRL